MSDPLDRYLPPLSVGSSALLDAITDNMRVPVHYRHRDILVVFVLAATLVLGPVAAMAVPSDSPATPSVEQVALNDGTETEVWLDETMARQLGEYNVPGAAVVIVREDQVALAKGYGDADLESQRPVVANETVFSIGSTGKLVTWTAVIQGVEDGHLKRDRDVNEYLTDSTVTVPDTYAESVARHSVVRLATAAAPYPAAVTTNPRPMNSQSPPTRRRIAP